jgi:hypothetical protein
MVLESLFGVAVVWNSRALPNALPGLSGADDDDAFEHHFPSWRRPPRALAFLTLDLFSPGENLDPFGSSNAVTSLEALSLEFMIYLVLFALVVGSMSTYLTFVKLMWWGFRHLLSVTFKLFICRGRRL